MPLRMEESPFNSLSCKVLHPRHIKKRDLWLVKYCACKAHWHFLSPSPLRPTGSSARTALWATQNRFHLPLEHRKQIKKIRYESILTDALNPGIRIYFPIPKEAEKENGKCLRKIALMPILKKKHKPPLKDKEK